MEDFEKLGVFYLGRMYDLASGKAGDGLLLYDSKDLTTHAMIIGMTGSGKTGLGIGLIEEAGLDKVPVIAVDPKGDLGNLLLTFPELRPEDFRPWISEQEAAAKGVSPDDLAATTAANWAKGLADSGQSGERIRKLRETVDMAIYTPGSSAGRPISVLRSFSAPPPAVRDDADLYAERIQATATSLLGLMGIDADPLTSREHVLIANIFQNAWNSGQHLDLAALIGAIQKPPFARVGVLDLDSFFPEKERFALAMKLNTLLAAPGFEAWMQGDPLDTGRLFYTDSGQPRISVISIAHLNDRERMFFLSMLLNDVISWMRMQLGTGSLRAMLYIDELFGYMPPVANPPSKTLLLTLLKQARAFGLGLALSTQNPVDLDYKGLANIGTWFIGRLQTERDKARVMEGLQGAAGGGPFDAQEIDRTLAALGKRVFLMRNVNDSHPEIFTTRWAMSYLAGPLTREQIRRLSPAPAPAPAPPAAARQPAAAPQPAAPAARASGPPLLPQGIQQYFLPANGADIHYIPMLVGAADVAYANARLGVQETRRVLRLCPIGDGPVPVDWADSQPLERDIAALQREGVPGATYDDPPAAALNAKNYAEWERSFGRWLRASATLTLLQSPALKLTARPGESERDFRIRLAQAGREQRDAQVQALRQKYAARIASLQDRLARAEANVQKESAQASQQTWNMGASVIGALFGGGRASRLGSGLGRVQKEQADVARAQEQADTVRRQLAELEAELQAELDRLDVALDPATAPLETVELAPKSGDITVHFVGLAWAPYRRDAQGLRQPAW
jgi:hypothetical protein